MDRDWKKSRAEQEMLDYENKRIADWKEKHKNDVQENIVATRDLYQELRAIGLVHDQCSIVLEWVNTLPIQITGNNHTVKIVDGIIKVSNTDEN